MSQTHLHEIMEQFSSELLELEVERLGDRIDDLKSRQQVAIDVLAERAINES